MAEIITHSFVSAKTQSPDTTLVSKNEWNDGHLLVGGTNGQLIVYDNTVDNNIKWIDGPGITGGTATSGATASPYTSGTLITLTPNSNIAGMYTGLSSVTTSGGAAYTIQFKQNGVDISSFGSVPSGVAFSFTGVFAPVAGSYTYTVVLTASAGTFLTISFSIAAFTIGRV